MKKSPLVTPWKKQKTENKYNLCLICQRESSKKVIKTPNIEYRDIKV